MSENSASDDFWSLLHQARAVLTLGGFVPPVPPRPQSASPAARQGGALDEVVDRYREHLAFGETWPEGRGSPRPRALILSDGPLSDGAVAFVRSWFENPRVQLSLEADLFLLPLPALTEPARSKDFVRDVAQMMSPKVLLSLGSVPAQRLLGAPLSLDSLRATDYRFESWSLVTTLNPEDFLRTETSQQTQFKAAVWKDLQRLLGKVRYG